MLKPQTDAVVQPGRTTSPVFDLLRMKAKAAPMGRARHVLALKTCVNADVFSLQRRSVFDFRGLVRHPSADLGGAGAACKVRLDLCTFQRRDVPHHTG